MKNKKIIIGMVAILLAIVTFLSFNYLKTRILWENVFDLKYEGTVQSAVGNKFIGWEYTLINETDNTYSVEYAYVHANPIITEGKTVKIKTYITLYPNSSERLYISTDDLLEALGIDNVPIWGDISIKGFDYSNK